MKLLAPLLALIVAVGVAVYLLGQRTGPALATEPDAVTTESPVLKDDVVLAAPEDAPEELRTEEATVVSSADEAGESAAAQVDEVEIVGTLVVLDDQGNEHTSESGTIEVYLLAPGESWSNEGGRTVEVRDGSFRLSIPRGLALMPEEILAGDRKAVILEGADREPFAEDGELHLRARWLYTHRLHVRDGDSGVELGSVELIEVRNWLMERNEHPGSLADVQKVHDAAQSPIELPPSRRSRISYHARSPGYAWGRLEIAPAESKDRYLDLFPGGGLEVSVAGAVPPKGAVLRLHGGEENSRPMFEQALRGSELNIDSVRPGDYRVRVEVGDWFDNPRVLGSSDATVVAGSTTPVMVLIEETEPVVKVPFEGVLVLPPEWGVSGGLMTIELNGTPMDGSDGRRQIDLFAMELIDKATGTRRWNAGKVEPGSYELQVFDIEYSAVVEVGPEGNTQARFEVPPPATVSVNIVDESTGQDALIDRLHWHSTRPAGVTGGGLGSEEPDENGRFEFLAPIGEIRISTWDGEFTSASLTLDVLPGSNSVTLRVKPSQGFLLKMRDGDSLIPWSWDYRLTVKAKVGDGKSGSRRTDEKGHTIFVTEPSTYIVELPTIEGFHPLEPREIDIPEGEVIELVVQFERLN